MIVQFPKIYEDELLYSVFSRFFDRSGYMVYRSAAEELLENPLDVPSIEFMGNISKGARAAIACQMPIKDAVLNHTMFPYYSAFIPKDRYDAALEAACNGSPELYNKLRMPKYRQCRFLRHCPQCIKEDRGQYGETYWHRSHQIYDIKICYKHGLKLIESDIEISGKASPRLYSAERSMGRIPTDYTEQKNSKEQMLLVYIRKVAELPYSDKIAPLGSFLHSRLKGTPYISPRGEERKMTPLFTAMVEYYSDSECLGKRLIRSRIEKMFTGYYYDTFDVCMLAMFLGITPEELMNRSLPDKSLMQEFDSQIIRLYNSGMGINKIARQFGVTSRTVRLSLERKGKAGQRKARIYTTPCGAKRKDWDALDEKYLPMVKKIMRKKESGRPKRITVSGMEEMLGLSGRSLANMPKCLAFVKANEVCFEEYWAREIEWAYNTLSDRNKILWRDIRGLTNISKKNAIKALQYIKDEKVKMLLEHTFYA